MKAGKVDADPPEDSPDPQRPDPASQDPADFARRFTAQMLGGPPQVREPVLPAEPPQKLTRAELLKVVGEADRANLAQWWRDQMAHVEYVVAQRAEVMASATEHPNAVFARIALAFGAEGKPRDLSATLLGLGTADFDAYYGREWALGSAEITGQIVTNLMRIALSSNDRSALKAALEVINRRAGEEWRQPAQKIELKTDRAGEGKLIDSSKLSYEDRQTLREIIQRSVASEAAGVAAAVVAGAITHEAQEL